MNLYACSPLLFLLAPPRKPSNFPLPVPSPSTLLHPLPVPILLFFLTYSFFLFLPKFFLSPVFPLPLLHSNIM